MTTRHGRVHLHRGDGDGTTLYLGDRHGAPYVSLDLRGFHGWSSSSWMPGGWAFFGPCIGTGRLFQRVSGRRWHGHVLLPAGLVDFWRWKVKRSGRRYMREHGHDQPMAAAL